MSVPQLSASEPTPKLGAALRQRHVTMIAPASIIGAGLFVCSSATLVTVGPSVAYLLAAKRQAQPQPGYGSATGYLSPIRQQAIEGRK